MPVTPTCNAAKSWNAGERLSIFGDEEATGEFLVQLLLFFADGGEVPVGNQNIFIEFARPDFERGVSLEEGIGGFHLPGGSEYLDAIDDAGRFPDGFGRRLLLRFGLGFGRRVLRSRR